MKLFTIPLITLLCCTTSDAVLDKGGFLRSSMANPVAGGSTISSPEVSTTDPVAPIELHNPSIGVGGVQINVQHATRVTTEQYPPVVSDCFVGSYNIGSDKLGFKMVSMDVTSEVDADVQTDGTLDQYMWGNMRYIDNDPPESSLVLPVASRFYALAQSPSAGHLHEEFEQAFCSCLKGSGLATYSEISNCAITYLVIPANRA